jgi:hypothetical protein
MQGTIFATNTVNRTRRIWVVRELKKKHKNPTKKKNNDLKQVILSQRQILKAY